MAPTPPKPFTNCFLGIIGVFLYEKVSFKGKKREKWEILL
jgi:hypothetical protein